MSVVASFTVQNERIKITNCEKTDKKNTDSKNKTKVGIDGQKNQSNNLEHIKLKDSWYYKTNISSDLKIYSNTVG